MKLIGDGLMEPIRTFQYFRKNLDYDPSRTVRVFDILGETPQVLQCGFLDNSLGGSYVGTTTSPGKNVDLEATTDVRICTSNNFGIS